VDIMHIPTACDETRSSAARKILIELEPHG
jgi:hypothetical protein